MLVDLGGVQFLGGHRHAAVDRLGCIGQPVLEAGIVGDQVLDRFQGFAVELEAVDKIEIVVVAAAIVVRDLRALAGEEFCHVLEEDRPLLDVCRGIVHVSDQIEQAALVGARNRTGIAGFGGYGRVRLDICLQKRWHRKR